MPFEQQIFDYFLKWFIPFLCAGLFSAIFIPLRNKNTNEKICRKKTIFLADYFKIVLDLTRKQV